MKSKKPYKLVLHTKVPKEIKAIDKPIRTSIIKAIDSLKNEPIPVGAARLKGRKNAYRLRVADYRIIYEIHATEIVIYIVSVAHRREVYQRLLQRR